MSPFNSGTIKTQDLTSHILAQALFPFHSGTIKTEGGSMPVKIKILEFPFHTGTIRTFTWHFEIWIILEFPLHSGTIRPTPFFHCFTSPRWIYQLIRLSTNDMFFQYLRIPLPRVITQLYPTLLYEFTQIIHYLTHVHTTPLTDHSLTHTFTFMYPLIT